ncbi:MAG: hypothetical protein DHS20C15_11490 [Planctomycetota bacterium]|nr:MAG: hypothetical protein DHS20C15_11490 [Planctomycetota bacterium]
MQSALLTAALLFGALATASPAQEIAPSTSLAEAQLGLVGSMSGAFNVPIGGSTGFATGVLTLGTPQYLMSLDLPQGPLFVNGVTGAISGPLLGTLRVFPIMPSADVFAYVGGSWTWHPLTGHGYFRADITLAGGTNPVQPIGRLRGMFEDVPQLSPSAFDPVGSFKGGWFFQLLTATPPRPVGDPFPGPGGGDA